MTPESRGAVTILLLYFVQAVDSRHHLVGSGAHSRQEAASSQVWKLGISPDAREPRSALEDHLMPGLNFSFADAGVHLF